MSDPLFARTRHVYGSYQDFWRLVEVSGFETCFVDQIRLDVPGTYIVPTINGEFRPHVENERTRLATGSGNPQRARLIWWNFERPDAPGALPWSETVSNMLEYVDQVWVADGWLATRDLRPLWVPLGSHPALALEPVVRGPAGFGPGLEYDVAMMAYMVPRRQTIEDACRKHGLRVAPHGWELERDRILRATCVMLNVHQHNDPMPVCEPLRWALAAAYRMALVTEHVGYPHPLLDPGEHYADAKYTSLVATATALARGPLAYDMGEALYQALCVDLPFRTCVNGALDGVPAEGGA